jgi:hypothetical protein
MSEAVIPYLPRRPRSAYIDRTPGRRISGDRRGWGKGWPEGTPLANRATVVVQRDLPGDSLDRVFRVQASTAHPRFPELVGLVLAGIQEVGFPLIGAQEVALRPNGRTEKQGGVGSYNNRPIKAQGGKLTASEHSRAIAYDLWSRSNPQRWDEQGRLRFWSTWHPLAVELVVAAGFEWGGHFWDLYDGTYCDAMHIEYRGAPASVPTAIERYLAKYAEVWARLHPEQPTEPAPPEEDAMSKADVLLIQQKLNEAGHSPPLLEDGVLGPITRAVIEALPALVDQRAELAAEPAESAISTAKQALDAYVEQHPEA